MPVAASTVTLLLVGILVAALATYLTIIAFQLSKVSFELGTVLIGVRAIEYQTRPLTEVVAGIGGDVGAIEQAFRGLLPADEPVAADANHSDGRVASG